jgi:hypothetical protein
MWLGEKDRRESIGGRTGQGERKGKKLKFILKYNAFYIKTMFRFDKVR